MATYFVYETSPESRSLGLPAQGAVEVEEDLASVWAEMSVFGLIFLPVTAISALLMGIELGWGGFLEPLLAIPLGLGLLLGLASLTAFLVLRNGRASYSRALALAEEISEPAFSAAVDVAFGRTTIEEAQRCLERSRSSLRRRRGAELSRRQEATYGCLFSCDTDQIRFACPRCKKEYRVPRHSERRRGRCASCRQSFRVPLTPRAGAPVAQG